MIPEQLQDSAINFCLIPQKSKKPHEPLWPEKKIKFNDSRLIDWLNGGGNYGVMGGGEKNLVLIDFDDEELQHKLEPLFPETFTVKSGGHKTHHLYYFSDKAKTFKILDKEGKDYADIQGQGACVVGPGSIHPNGNKYEVVKDVPIAFLNYAEIRARFAPYNIKDKALKTVAKNVIDYDKKDSYLKRINSTFSMDSILELFGVNTSQNPSNCPFGHESNGGKCFSWNDEVWHCFHCDESGNKISLVKKLKNLDFKQALKFIAEQFNDLEEFENRQSKYLSLKNDDVEAISAELAKGDDVKAIQDHFKRLTSRMTGTKDDNKATEFLALLSENKLWIKTLLNDVKNEVWYYDEGIYVPDGRSRIKVLLREYLGELYDDYWANKAISKIELDTAVSGLEFFNSNYAGEIPVQNGILNLNTHELSPFTPNKLFFSKINARYDITADCPKFKSFLNEVLPCEDDIKLIFEIIGYCLFTQYKYHRAFMFTNSTFVGRNGKGSTLRMITKFLGGKKNVTSIALRLLTDDNFGVSALHGKLANISGDLSSKQISADSIIKQLTGGDAVEAKRKFLKALEFDNYAKMIFACNELPKTSDTTDAFFDRWVLLKFPFKFVSQKDYDEAIDKTPLRILNPNKEEEMATPEEFNGMLIEALKGFKRLELNKGFTYSKNSNDVKNEWIRLSDNVLAFCKDCLILSDGKNISKHKFRKAYNNYCKYYRLTIQKDKGIYNSLNDFGATSRQKNSEEGFGEKERVWEGIEFNTLGLKFLTNAKDFESETK